MLLLQVLATLNIFQSIYLSEVGQANNMRVRSVYTFYAWCDRRLSKRDASMTQTTGLINLVGDLLSIAPPQDEYTPETVNEMNPWEKARLEKILGKRISPLAVAHYSTEEEYEQSQGISMIW